MDEAALRCGAAFASCHWGKLKAWSFEADQCGAWILAPSDFPGCEPVQLLTRFARVTIHTFKVPESA